MKSEILLSIIVPIYNGADTIQKTVSSMLAVKRDDIELIFVDDGSVDNTPEILRAIVKSDPRCKIIRQENRGVSAARNSGLEIARGKYIYFCDSDDDVIPKTLEQAVGLLQEDEIDLWIFDFWHHFSDSSEDRKSGFMLPSDRVLEKEELVRLILMPLICFEATDFPSVCNKFFSRRMLEENRVLFDEKVAYGEDWRFVVDAVDAAANARYIPQTFYIYNQPATQESGRYRHQPGLHLLGAQARKWRLSEKYGIEIPQKTRVAQCKNILAGIVFSAANRCEKAEFRAMIRSETAQTAAKKILDLPKEERLSCEITRRHLLAARFIIWKNTFLVRLFAKSRLGKKDFDL